jgi:hypothetical protein
VTAVTVSLDDAERAVQRAESAGYRVQREADGTALLAAPDLNGVAFVHPATTHGVPIEVMADPLPSATS